MTYPRWEYGALLGLASIFLFFLLLAMFAARSEVRDDLRRQDITNLKRSLEQYYNAHVYYPSPPRSTAGCTSSSSESWFFGKTSLLLNEQVIDAIPHDTRERQGHVYTYCVTGTDSSHHAQGYYLQAQLERPEAAVRAFDEDEERKFHYRILHENGQVLYRVCGGNEKQCEG